MNIHCCCLVDQGVVMTPQFSLKFFAVYNLLAKFIAEKMIQM